MDIERTIVIESSPPKRTRKKNLVKQFALFSWIVHNAFWPLQRVFIKDVSFCIWGVFCYNVYFNL